MIDDVKGASAQRRAKLQEKVHLHLKQAFIAGRFAPGQVLTVREIAERVGTSPMPVREAMGRLANSGALQIMRNGSARVAVIGEGEWSEIRDVRLRLEGLAARLAASLLTPAGLRTVEAANRAMVAAGTRRDLAAIMAENRRFHFSIYEACGNPTLIQLIETVWLRIGCHLRSYVEAYADRMRGHGEGTAIDLHEPLVDALRLRDGDAAEAWLRADLCQSYLLMRPGAKEPYQNQ